MALGQPTQDYNCNAGTGALGVLITHETSLLQATITRTTHLATASQGSDALAPPGSVEQV